MKKVLALLLALAMVFAFAACGKEKSPGDTANKPDGITASDDRYVIKFASSFGEGSDFNTMIEVPLKELLEKHSDGRMTLEVYPSGSLAAQGKAIDAVKTGTADMGYDMTAIYAGKYPYLELFEIPGFDIPGSEYGSGVLRAYYEKFCGDYFKDVKLFSIYSTGNLVISSSKKITSAADLKGVSIRASGTQIAWIGNMGGVGVAMPVTEVYENIRLNIAQGALLSTYAVTTFNLQEVAKYVTELPMVTGTNVIVINKDLYDSMNQYDKGVIDKVMTEFDAVSAQYGDKAIAKAEKALEGKVEIIELDETAKQEFIDAGQKCIQDKVKTMNDAGLKGTDAYNWIMDNIKK